MHYFDLLNAYKKAITTTLTLSVMFATPISVANEPSQWLNKVSEYNWYSGEENCQKSTAPVFDTVQVNPQTYILRQSKCSHFEAPFLYLLLGEKRALLLDTGAKSKQGEFSPYKLVSQLVEQHKATNGITDYSLIVSHSHSHSDHYGGDEQFKSQIDVEFIAPNSEAVEDFFKFGKVENAQSMLDLGKRKLTVMHIPGHQDDSIAIYDPQTKWLLTGDSVYPGRLYIRHWATFKHSIARLSAFTDTHDVSAVMGTHIEMSATPGQDYPMGATYQPNEAPLPLSVEDLKELNNALTSLKDEPTRQVLDKVIIYPVGEPNVIQRVLAWFVN